MYDYNFKEMKQVIERNYQSFPSIDEARFENTDIIDILHDGGRISDSQHRQLRKYNRIMSIVTYNYYNGLTCLY